MRTSTVCCLLSIIACSPPRAVSEPEPVAEPVVTRPLVEPPPIVVTPANPAVLGGQLATLDDAVAVADVEADRVLLVDPDSGQRLADTTMPEWSQPFRPTEGADGMLWVSLRRAETVVGLDPQTLETRATVRTCVEPRGLAAEPDGSMWVACADGQLVHFDASGVRERLRTAPDLRDVVFDAARETLWVSRFRSAEVLEFGVEGALLRHHRLPGWSFMGDRRVAYTARVAWRMIAHPEGGVVLVHQRHRETSVNVLADHRPTNPEVPTGAYGMPGPRVLDPEVIRRERCSGVLHGAVTHLPGGTEPARTTTALLAAVLATDLQIDEEGRLIVAVAGAEPDSDAPGRLLLVDEESFTATDPCHEPELLEPADDALLTSLAWGSGGELVTLAEWPLSVSVDGVPVFAEPAMETAEQTALRQFHRTPAFGVSCASCHPEGHEDGHTWLFASLGVVTRRSQPLGNEVLSAPGLHRDGEFETFDELFEEAWVRRMGGAVLSDPEVTAIGEYIDRVAVPRSSPADPSLVDEGEQVFVAQGCASCHSGDRFTDDRFYGDQHLRTPSLIGVGQRLPLMHDGCAPTLHHLFDPSCTSWHLHHAEPATEHEIQSLVSYLQTL